MHDEYRLPSFWSSLQEEVKQRHTIQDQIDTSQCLVIVNKLRAEISLYSINNMVLVYFSFYFLVPFIFIIIIFWENINALF
jgi:hypothetical protein